jgi:RimJ/RimL family protein N-acetyltransferase
MPSEDRLTASRSSALRLIPVRIRPITPRDATHLQSYVRHLSRESRHNRFLGALNELSPRELERLSHPDQTSANVLIAEVDVNGEWQMIGEAPYAAVGDAATYEFAISVADEWQRRGIGTRMVRRIEQQVANLGAHYLVADALQSNQTVRHLARTAGFVITRNSHDARLMRLSKCMHRQIPVSCSWRHSLLAAERQSTASGAF